MEKKVLIAFVLALVVIVGYSRLMAKLYPQPVVPIYSPQTVKENTPPLEYKEPVIQTQPIANEEVTIYNTEKYEITISNIGGAIKQISLKEYSGKDPGTYLNMLNPDITPGVFSLIDLDGENLYSAIYDISKGQNAVICRYRVPGKFEIIKKYYFSNNAYHIELEQSIKNLSLESKQYKYRIVGGSGIDMGGRLDKRFVGAELLVNGELKRISLRKIGLSPLLNNGTVLWTGLKNKYFSIILKPHINTEAGFFSLPIKDNLQAGVETTTFSVAPNTYATHKFLLYAGPNDYEILASYNFRFEEIINYGVFGGISKILLATLKFFHRIIGNWGASIMLLTFVVSLLLYPLTHKSMKSMREMQAIQPQITKLKETYKDNSQKLNREVMEIYRKHKINPLGGCLPMFFQMPIFIALYQTLIRSIELKGAQFLWIKDLSQADALGIPFSLPVLGNSVNILPILMSAAMFLQQKVSQPGGHAQTEQQKQMAVFMPVLFGIIFYSLPSGLVLYWLTNTTLTVIYQGIAKKGHI